MDGPVHQAGDGFNVGRKVEDNDRAVEAAIANPHPGTRGRPRPHRRRSGARHQARAVGSSPFRYATQTATARRTEQSTGRFRTGHVLSQLPNRLTEVGHVHGNDTPRAISARNALGGCGERPDPEMSHATRRPRPAWRRVAIPTEHGGWGLTVEAVLLGLLVRPSVAGGAIGLAALLAFVARTPLKLAVVDRRRHRRLERSVLAERIAGGELSVLVVMAVVASLSAHGGWWAPLAGAVPFFVVSSPSTCAARVAASFRS